MDNLKLAHTEPPNCLDKIYGLQGRSKLSVWVWTAFLSPSLCSLFSSGVKRSPLPPWAWVREGKELRWTHNLQSCPGCSRALGEMSAWPDFAPSIPQKSGLAALSADRQQCTWQGMEIHVHTYGHSSHVTCRCHTGGTLQLHTMREVQTHTWQHCSVNPPRQSQERSVLHWSMQGSPKQLRAVQDDIPSRAGEKNATQCCHAAVNTAQAMQAGTGGCRDSWARDTLQEGKLETVQF